MTDQGDGPIVPDEVLTPSNEDAPDLEAPEGPPRAKATPHTYAREGWQTKFLETLAKMPNVRAACEIAGVSRGYAYRLRAEDEQFRAAWDSAIEDAIDRLEQAAWKRATVGIERVTYNADGSVRSRELVFSDRLTELLLKRWRPQQYRERFDINVTDTTQLDREILQLAEELGVSPDALPGSARDLDTAPTTEGSDE